jgi:ATP-binding cassette subfamily B protein RaxB
MSRLAELNLARRPRLPVVLAAEAAECGLACLTMVARFHGHDIDLNGLRQRFALSLSGASLGSLMRLADSLALSGRARCGSSLKCWKRSDCRQSCIGTSTTSSCLQA